MKRTLFLWLLLLLSHPLHAQFFEKNNLSLALSLGQTTLDFSGGQGSETYTTVGTEANYFVIDRLSIGAGYRYWSGSPELHELTLQSTHYFLLKSSDIYPYTGIFLRRFMTQAPLSDFNAYGGRAGLAYELSKSAYIAGGWSLEKWDACEQFENCSFGYIEVMLGFSF